MAKLFVYCAFDQWMATSGKMYPVRRYADDAIVHCGTQEEPQRLRRDIAERLSVCGLELNEQQPRIAIATTQIEEGATSTRSFPLLGYKFRSRKTRN